MLSKRIIKHMKLRLGLTKYCWGTFTNYDKKTDKITPPNNYQLFQMIFGAIGGGIIFVSAHALQLYFKLNKDEIPEESGAPEDPQAEKHAMFEFVTIVIGWGELAVVASITCILIRALSQYNNIVYVFNEMFSYSEQLHKMLEEKNIGLDRQHKLAARKLETTIYLSSYFSLVVGFLIAPVCLHSLEPTHVLIKEWFELEFEWHPKLAPFMLLFQLGVSGCANTIMMYGYIGIAYTYIASTVLDDMTVESVKKRQGARTTLETRFYGDMEDVEICQMYRTLRYLSERVNEILGSVLISFHQVGMLAAFAILLFFFVKFQNVIWDVGPLACVVIVSAIFTPLLICFCQSNFFGTLVEVSEDFMDCGLKIVPRNTMYKRFILSCQAYYVEEAYPFFHYHRNTFLEFCMAGLDHAISLMLW